MFEAFYGSEQARTCPQCGTRAPRQGLIERRGTRCRRAQPLRAQRLAGAARGRPGLAADRLRTRRDDHGGLAGVPPDPRATAGTRPCGSRTWTPTGSPSRWCRRRRSSSATQHSGRGRHEDRQRSSTTSPWRSAPVRRSGSSRSARCRCRTPTPPARELDRCLAAGHARRRDRQPRRRPRPRRRGRRHVPPALRGRGRAGVRPPVGHARLAPAAAAGWPSGWSACPPRPTCRSSPWCSAACSTGSTGRCGSASPTAAARSPFWLGPDGQRLASATRRHRHVGAPAVALRRPVPASTRSSSTRRRCGCSSTRSAPTRSCVGSDYPYPLGEAPGGRCRALGSVPRRADPDRDPGRQRASVPRPGSEQRSLSWTSAESRARALDADGRRALAGAATSSSRPPRAGPTPKRPTWPATRSACSRARSASASTRFCREWARWAVEGHTEARAAVGELSRAAARARGPAGRRAARGDRLDELADGQPAPA